MTLLEKLFRSIRGNNCPPDVNNLVEVFFASGSGAEFDRKKESAEEQLKDHPSRASAVVPLTRKYRQDPKKNQYKVCSMVEVIGVPECSFDLLLKIFKDGRKAKAPFDEWGNSKTDFEDYATYPAYLLVCQIENGPARLKKRLSQTEYEEAIARAHSWNGKYRPLLAEALADVGSHLAMLRLLHDILQTELRQESRDPAIRALGSFGHRFLQDLIEELKFRRPSDRKAQTTYLRDILSVLAICGDKTCVDPIVNVAQRDASIGEDARRALVAIGARDHTFKIPEVVGAQPIPVRRLPATGDRYVDQCFECNWSELDEPRIWSDDPELEKVADLANHRRNDEALAQLRKVWGKYPDHDFVYGWKALILARQSHQAEALEVLDEGMAKCRKKFGLCSDRAQIEYDAGKLNEAVLWWIRSAAAQISAQGPAIDSPFLYLAYIAGALGDYKSKEQLLKVVDRLTRWGRLNESATSQIHRLVATRGNKSMTVAISRLCKEFLG